MSLLDLAKKAGIESIVDETIKQTPELTRIPSKELVGRVVKTWVLVALGNTTGSFRHAGEGTAPIKHQWEQRMVECFNLEPHIEEDAAVADADEDGREAYMDVRTKAALRGEWIGLVRQLYYGTGNNAKGFPGLIASYDSANMEVDAGGTTANTGSSAWLIRANTDDGVLWRWGSGGAMGFDPVTKRPMPDPNDATKRMNVYHTAFNAYPGVQVKSKKAVCRIKKLTEDSGKGLTDAIIRQGLRKFEIGMGPNIILVSARSMGQLTNSRTATSPTGAPAPWVTSVLGFDGVEIPVVATPGIVDTESLTL